MPASSRAGIACCGPWPAAVAQARERAEDSGLEDAGTLARAVREAEIVFSVCPPHAARDLARFEAAGLPAGFHLAAADIYRRLEEFKDAAPPMDEVKAALLRRS